MLFIAISTNYVFDTMSRIALVTHSPLTSTSVSTGSPLSSPTATLTTGPEMHALHIASYHRAMMQKAAESIDLVASSRRDISAVTMSFDCVSGRSLVLEYLDACRNNSCFDCVDSCV